MDLDESLYDEFGNYVGPPLSGSEDEGEVSMEERGKRDSPFGGSGGRRAAGKRPLFLSLSPSPFLSALLSLSPSLPPLAHSRTETDSPPQADYGAAAAAANYGGFDDDEGEEQLDDDALDAAEAAANARAFGASSGAAAGSSPPPPASNAVVLHEDKRYYPSARDVYGPGVETLAEEEDAQPIEVPIIAPRRATRVEVGGVSGGGGRRLREAAAEAAEGESDGEDDAVGYRFDPSIGVPRADPRFAAALSATPSLVRSVAVLGALHAGKTSLVDALVEASHVLPPRAERAESGGVGGGMGAHAPAAALQQRWGPLPRPRRFSDARVDEQARGVSVKATPLSLVLADSRGKSMLVNVVDAPGHVDFRDEACAACRLADGALLCVDAAEGATAATRALVRECVRERLPISLVVTKVDRLITELKLPPGDAYHKLRRVVDETNAAIRACLEAEAADALRGGGWGLAGAPASPQRRLDPASGNVAFAAPAFGWSFTLPSFAQLYADVFGVEEEAGEGKEGVEEEEGGPGGGERRRGAASKGTLPRPPGTPPRPFDPSDLARRLWGDVWFHPASRAFKRSPPPGKDRASAPRSFVEFVLEPLYKLHSHALSAEGADGGGLAEALGSLGVSLRPSQLAAGAKPLLRSALTAVLGGPEGLVSMVAREVPSAVAGAAAKVGRIYSGPLGGGGGVEGGKDGAATPPPPRAAAMLRCDASSPFLAVSIAKLVPTPDATRFDALARVLSGTLRPGARVRVLGEAYAPDDGDDEDSAPAVVGRLWALQARYRVPIASAPAGGSWVLIEGVDATIRGAATLVEEATTRGGGGGGEGGDGEESSVPYAFRPLPLPPSAACVKVAVEPLSPSDLPKMVDGLRSVAKSYPGLAMRVEESGEHALFASGELALESALRDLRELFGGNSSTSAASADPTSASAAAGLLEVKVSDPCVALAETVAETSALRCFARTPNGLNRLSAVAEPLEEGLADAIEELALTSRRPLPPSAWPRRRAAAFFGGRGGWDALASRSVWCFGPDASCGPNVLLDDTLPMPSSGLPAELEGGNASSSSYVDKSLLASIRSSVVAGFQWGAREGPLCDEPMRSVKLRLVGAEVAGGEGVAPSARSGGQIIPTARRAAYSAFLTASPRLMEPVYSVEVTSPADCVQTVYALLARRRGRVLLEAPRPGTPLSVLAAHLPVLDSFGFETDLRVATQGQAFCQSVFDHWAVVPGDPLDRTVRLAPLEPAPPAALARDLVVKTRRRKGMAEDVSVGRFFDDPMLMELAAADLA